MDRVKNQYLKLFFIFNHSARWLHCWGSSVMRQRGTTRCVMERARCLLSAGQDASRGACCPKSMHIAINPSDNINENNGLMLA